jgi:signal transduction histidine kinase
MIIFRSQEARRVVMLVSAVLIGSIVIGLLLIQSITEDYKRNLLSHDTALAGALSKTGVSSNQIAAAFSAEKTADEVSAGEKILQAAGFHQSIHYSLIPEALSFRQKYFLVILLIFIAFSAVIAATLLVSIRSHEKRMVQANQALQRFMHGETQIRLEDTSEDSLSQLFTTINGMATSLTTHMLKEKQNKEFLKDTISDISHQLKTPLAALQMYTEIIGEEKTDNAVVKKFTLKSENELKRMENLIRNLLKLARLDADAIPLEKKKLNFKKLLEELAEEFYTRAELENKTLSLVCPDGTLLEGDGDWLLEAISNIIKNAFEHTLAGNRIEILCEETPLMITLSIKDNGTGIHPQDLPFVFKRFYRSRFSQNRQGTGIGLTLSKTMIEKHGGSILVESELDKGTAFHLFFPKLTNS